MPGYEPTDFRRNDAILAHENTCNDPDLIAAFYVGPANRYLVHDRSQDRHTGLNDKDSVSPKPKDWTSCFWGQRVLESIAKVPDDKLRDDYKCGKSAAEILPHFVLLI